MRVWVLYIWMIRKPIYKLTNMFMEKGTKEAFGKERIRDDKLSKK